MATQLQEPPPASGPGPAPTEPDPVAQTLALIQPWIEFVPPQQRRLGLFIFLALLAHLAAFLFLRIDTTRAEWHRQPRTHVTVENTQSPTLSARQPGDDFWDRLTDPRLFLLPQQSPETAASDDPSFDFATPNTNIGNHQLPPAAEPADYQFAQPVTPPLEQRLNEAMTPARQPFVYQEAPPAIATKTTWQWDAKLAVRQPTNVSDLPSPVSDTDLSPTQLSVAVGSTGSVEHVLVEQSCGNMGASVARDLDQQAVLAARKIHFTPTDKPGLLWGKITIFWHFSAKPREEVVPTPPSAQ